MGCLTGSCNASGSDRHSAADDNRSAALHACHNRLTGPLQRCILFCLALCHVLFVFFFNLLLIYMRREFLAVGGLVERTVEGGEEEHEYLGTHSEEQHEVCSRQVGEFE